MALFFFPKIKSGYVVLATFEHMTLLPLLS